MEDLERTIARHALAPLPVEGGWFRRTATSAATGPEGRPAWSEILYLMSPEGFSALHALATTETWTHLEGAAAEMLLLGPGGAGRLVTLGPGGEPGVRVEPGVWQGTRTLGAWTLCRCRVEPAWQEGDFTLGPGDVLAAAHPAWADAIRARVRGPAGD